MMDEVEKLAAKIKDKALREKVIDLLKNPSLDTPNVGVATHDDSLLLLLLLLLGF